SGTLTAVVVPAPVKVTVVNKVHAAELDSDPTKVPVFVYISIEYCVVELIYTSIALICTFLVDITSNMIAPEPLLATPVFTAPAAEPVPTSARSVAELPAVMVISGPSVKARYPSLYMNVSELVTKLAEFVVDT